MRAAHARRTPDEDYTRRDSTRTEKAKKQSLQRREQRKAKGR